MGCDSAEVSPGGFGSDPLRIVSSGDEEFGGGVVADPVDLEECGCGLADEWSEHPVEPLRLLTQELNPMSQSPNRDQGRISDWVVAFPWSECRGFVDQGDRRQP